MKQISAHILYVKQLNVISNAEDWKRSFLKYRLEPRLENDGKIRQLEEKILQVKEQAKAIGIEVTICSEIPLNSQKKGRHCLATPLEAVYFSYEGKVAPCCHFGHHVSRFFEGEYYPPSSLCYGDIRSQGFLEVWNSPTFRAFRSGFVTQNYPEECRTCYLLYGK